MRRDTRQYVVELDDTIWRCQDGVVEQVDHLDDVRGDRWLIFDHQTSITRTMVVEAPVKYAEVIVRKKLQESGEVDGPVHLFTYHKERKSANSTQVFFTAVPNKISDQYFEKIREGDDSILLFPVYSILYRLLRRMGGREPIAVVFQHGQFADLVIGNKKRVYYANRAMAFDESNEQMSSLWDMVMSDISTAEKEGRLTVGRIFLVNWIRGAGADSWPGNTDKQVISMPAEKVVVNGREAASSFLRALRSQSATGAFSPPLEKLAYYSQGTLPWLNAALVTAVVLFLVGYLWCNQKIQEFDQALVDTQKEIAALVPHEPVRGISYEETFSFLNDLDYYRRVPSYKQVVNDMSEALPENMTVQVFKLDYAGHDISVEVYGKARSAFADAHKAYSAFTEALEKKGYVLSESRFDTRIRESEFLSRFTKRVL